VVNANFVVRDTINDLSAIYQFNGGGVAQGGFGPVNINDETDPTPFSTELTKVTRFGPTARLFGINLGLAVPVPGIQTLMFAMRYKADDGRDLNTGSITLQAAVALQTTFGGISTADICAISRLVAMAKAQSDDGCRRMISSLTRDAII
jgi:hypothetical protein